MTAGFPTGKHNGNHRRKQTDVSRTVRKFRKTNDIKHCHKERKENAK